MVGTCGAVSPAPTFGERPVLRAAPSAIRGKQSWHGLFHIQSMGHPVAVSCCCLDKTYCNLIIQLMNTINWQPKAAKQLRKLPSVAQIEIRDEVKEKLSVFPQCTGVKHLTNHEYPYRLRVGNYRVFFEFDGGVKVVNIEEVKKRDERTY